MKSGEIRAMSEAAILGDVADTKKKVLELRCAIALGDAVNPAELKTMRKNIARLKTIHREKTATADQKVAKKNGAK